MKRQDVKANKKVETKGDFFICSDGSVCLFVPLTQAGLTWLEAHCPADDEHHYLGRSLVVGHRFLGGLIKHAIEDGLAPMV